jgi:hypothetical protein
MEFERTKNYSPFRKDLSLTRGGKKNTLTELEIVTNLIRNDLDLDIGNVGFLVEGSRHEAAFNRFIHREKSIYPVVSKEYVQDRWQKFLREEKLRVEECVFLFCLSNGLVAQRMEQDFWNPAYQHSKLPKEFEMIRNFAKCLRDTFLESEYPRELGKFFSWVEALERDVAMNQFAKPKAKVASDKVQVVAVDTAKPILFTDTEGNMLSKEDVGNLTILTSMPQTENAVGEGKVNTKVTFGPPLTQKEMVIERPELARVQVYPATESTLRERVKATHALEILMSLGDAMQDLNCKYTPGDADKVLETFTKKLETIADKATAALNQKDPPDAYGGRVKSSTHEPG